MSQSASAPRIPSLRFPEFSGEWEERKLESVTKVYDGTHTTPNYVSQGIPFYSVEHVTSNNFSNTKFIEPDVFEKENKRVKLENLDILMTRIGDIGTSRIIDWDVTASFYVSLALIKRSDRFNSKFLNQFIKSVFFQRQLHQKTLHVAFPKKINLGEIGACSILLPSLLEQTKIAAFLSYVDSKIDQLTQKKALLEQYKKGVMQQVFSQQIRFKADDGCDYPEWEEKKLGEVGEIVTGKTPSTTDESLWDGNIQFVTPTDISDRKYQDRTIRNVSDHPKLKKLPIGSTMFTCIASIGKMSISTKECITNQQINSIVPFTDHNNEYVYYAVLSIAEFIKSTQANTTLPIINKTEFSKFCIPIPCLSEQTKIANFLSAIDSKIEQVGQQLEAAKLFKKGLLQQMFVWYGCPHPNPLPTGEGKVQNLHFSGFLGSNDDVKMEVDC